MEQDATNTGRKSFAHPLEALCLILIFICFILFLISLLEVFGIPYGLDYGEGYLSNMSLEMVGGNNPYHDIDEEPWIVSSYPPMFPLINGLIMSALGRSLLVGRFIATASLIGMIVFSVMILRRFGVGASIAIILSCLLFAYSWPVKWAQVVRVDTLGIMFALSGIYFFIKSDRISDTVISAILFGAAALTKQSLLAAPLACLIFSLIYRDKRTVPFFILLILLIPGLYLLINLITSGGFFNHLFNYTANQFHLSRMTQGLGTFFQDTLILQIIALSSLFIPGATDGTRKVLVLYWILSNLTLFTYGYTGSDTNYYIEPLLSTALLASLAVKKLAVEEKITLPVSSRSMAFALLIAVVITGRFIEPSDFRVHRMTDEKLQNGTQLIGLCATAPGDILSEDASYTFLAGKTVIIQPYIMTLLSRTEKWDQEPFLRTIRENRYSLIILRVDLNDPYNTERSGGAWEIAGFDRWTDEMERAIMENYSLFGPLDTGVGNSPWFLYQRKADIRIHPDEPHLLTPVGN
ncbi:MAG TPA: hypothetical protein ENN67_03610 [Firmicutes bacterium]|nr:hypothetical protein [Bacillota bacterium]